MILLGQKKTSHYYMRKNGSKVLDLALILVSKMVYSVSYMAWALK